MTLASLSYAIGASYGKARIQSTDRYVVAAGTLVFAALYVWIMALAVDGSPVAAHPAGDASSASSGSACWARSSPTSCTSSCSPTWAPPSSTMVTYMFPVVGVTLGVFVLGEVLDARLLLGTGLVVLGIAIVGLRYDSVVSLATRVARR